MQQRKSNARGNIEKKKNIRVPRSDIANNHIFSHIRYTTASILHVDIDQPYMYYSHVYFSFLTDPRILTSRFYRSREYAKLLRWPFLRSNICAIDPSVMYACVRACGRRDYRVRVCPRETHAAGGRPHTRTRVYVCTDMTARRTHSLTRYQAFAERERERVEFVEITFSRVSRARNATVIRQESESPQWLTAIFRQYTCKRVFIYHKRSLARFPVDSPTNQCD